MVKKTRADINSTFPGNLISSFGFTSMYIISRIFLVYVFNGMYFAAPIHTTGMRSWSGAHAPWAVIYAGEL